MTPTLLALSLAMILPGEPLSKSELQRKTNPIAPSLPLLTDEEEEKIDRIIERFIQSDLGKLRGEDAKRAVQDFQQLGPEAIPALIRGMNQAANIEASCPAVVIAKKLSPMLAASKDHDLLDFARENIGIGVTSSKHMGILKDLKVACIVRKTALGPKSRMNLATAETKAPRSMSVFELAEAAGSERGNRLKQVIAELGQRRGDQAIAALGSAAGSYEGEVRQMARDSLYRNLSRESSSAIKRGLKDDRPAVRAAAAQIVGDKGLRYGDELIDLLSDSEPEVQQAAQHALVRLNRGTDYGPAKDSSEADREAAVRQWRAWWSKQNRR